MKVKYIKGVGKMIIYNPDGTTKIVKDSEVEIINWDSEKIRKICQVGKGVDIIMKDGSVQHLSNANTDGNSIWFDLGKVNSVTLTDEEYQKIKLAALDLRKFTYRTDYGDWLDHEIEYFFSNSAPKLFAEINRLRKENRRLKGERTQ